MIQIKILVTQVFYSLIKLLNRTYLTYRTSTVDCRGRCSNRSVRNHIYL